MIIYEMNARVHGKRFDKITKDDLKKLAGYGFDWLWVMGIWRISEAGRAISRIMASDFEGSPYAITTYDVNPDLGGDKAFAKLVERAHSVGLKVMADFVPNHMAVDSPLIDEHPEYFIHSNPDLRDENPTDYFVHRSGRKLAHGKDPYFAGWTDTVQLDYVHPDLRAHQINELKRLATMVDGLRCDMAMLLLKEQIKNQWFPRVGWDQFNYYMPNEFWSDAISTIKYIRPDFVFMAEVYWDKEHYLQQLGFDLTYDKKLYDMLAHNNEPERISQYFNSVSYEYISRSVHFLENHDEERAAHRFGWRQRPAAVISFTIPGVPFVHQGQMDGFAEKLPVQRVRPLKEEVPNEYLRRFYLRLLEIVKTRTFREGDMFTLGVQSGILLVRRKLEGQAALIGVDTTGRQQEASPAIELSLGSIGFNRGAKLKFTDLWTGKPIEKVIVEEDFIKLDYDAVPSWSENMAFLISVTTV